MSQASPDILEAGRDALRRHNWEEARSVLGKADRAGQLDGEGLRLLGKALDWCGDMRGSLDVFERSYAAFIAAGNRRRAAMVALMIRHQLANVFGDASTARGWAQRAERLLASEPECVELGFLWRVQGRRAFLEGRPDEGRQLIEKAVDLGTRLDNRNLVAMSLAWLGMCLAAKGHAEEGYALLDEACASALGGELGPYATGIVYCNAIGAYRDAGEFAIGSKWSENATRWCKRESITGFSGICRVHGAEFMRLRGELTDAEREATQASGELQSTPTWAGEAHYEIGEVRLRLGDYAGADAAFRQAHQLGREPMPGAALLLWAEGKGAEALRSLASVSLNEPQYGVLDRMRCLAALAAVACDLQDLPRAMQAAQQAEETASTSRALGIEVLAVQARGSSQLAAKDTAAHETLHRALMMWLKVNAPYEAAQVRLLLAKAHRLIGDEAGARREIEAGVAAFEKLGAVPAVAQARMMLDTAATSGMVAQRTLFFSDVVGSTQLIEAIGDQSWSELSAWLEGSLRQCFASHGGEEVNYTGDGFFVAFPDAMSAAQCAITIQRRLADHRRQHGFAPRIRIGIHSAEVSQSRNSYSGRGVHEASRIAELAGPDEIVASRDSVPSGVPTSEPREVTVKGISRPICVVIVDWKSR